MPCEQHDFLLWLAETQTWLGDCFLCSSQVVLSPALGGDELISILLKIQGDLLQISGFLSLCSFPLLVLCSVNSGYLIFHRLLEAPSPQLGKTTSLLTKHPFSCVRNAQLE